ncbi:MAG: hypothetical protein AAGC67_03795 [Myxococcota bacterium]
MARTAIGVAIGIAFVAAVIYYALDATSVRCEICVEYKGRQACSVSQAADLQMAEMQAHSGACSQVTGGVTETLECDRTPAASRSCTQ